MGKEVNRELWDRVDELRGNMSIRELAEKSGLNEGSLQTTRSLGSQPKLGMLYPISKVLGTTIEYLYTGQKPEIEFEDYPIFRKISSSETLIRIAERLTEATAVEIEMVCRILNIEKGHISNTMESGIA